jgi:hypothetical protein
VLISCRAFFDLKILESVVISGFNSLLRRPVFSNISRKKAVITVISDSLSQKLEVQKRGGNPKSLMRL